MSINYSELKKKQVIDVSSGANLGKITDLVIEEDSGRILKIIVSGKMGGFLSCDLIELDYHCITRIGDDTVLYKKCPPPRPRKGDGCGCDEPLGCDYDND